jgi:DNA-binding response OmpR family regulator
MPTILLIDDEARVGAALRFALEPHGFHVEQVTSAAAGEARARDAQPDCILLDVSLDDADGLDVCRHLKSDPRTAAIPLLLLTGHVDPASVARGLEAGADDYVPKPFTPRELRARIDAHLRRSATEGADD